MSATFNDDFYLSFYAKVLNAIQAQVGHAERTWYGLSHQTLNEMKSLKQLHGLNDEKKLDFAKAMICTFYSFRASSFYLHLKRINARNESTQQIAIPLTEEEKREYQRYYDEVIIG